MNDDRLISPMTAHAVREAISKHRFRRVILESPYAGTSRYWPIRLWQRWQNIRYARRCLRHSLKRGEAPIASHLLYTQRGVLDDDIPTERKLGIDAGLSWRVTADAAVVYCDRGISRGMEFGMQAATDAGLTVERRWICDG